MKKASLFAIGLSLLLNTLLTGAQEPKPDAGRAKPLEAGTYQVRNQKFKDLLRPKDANNADGTRIVLYSPEPWKCMTWTVRPARASAFRVQNLFTSKTFAADPKTKEAQQAVIQVPLDSKAGPMWQFTKLEDGSYKITDAESGKALTAAKVGNGDEAKITVEPWRDQAEQKWELQKIDPKQLTM